MQLYDEALLARTLEYIRKYQETEGKSPSYRTIMHEVKGYNVIGKVQRYLKVLNDRGLI